MIFRLLWLLLNYIQFARSNLITDYEEITQSVLFPTSDDRSVDLPIELGVDRHSGCICRGSHDRKVIVCFGNYECRRFPRISHTSEVLRVRTSVIREIVKGHLDRYYYLSVLDIEANYQLKYIEAGAFRNLTKLKHLSISYNTGLRTISENLFEGLVNLRNLTLVNNGFENVYDLTAAFRPSILPSLKSLDLSENQFGTIPKDTFKVMEGTLLKKLDLNLCSLDYVHPESFLPLRMLQELNIGENELNGSLIGDFLVHIYNSGINLVQLDLCGMGFRKKPPRLLLDIIAGSSIKRLILAQNQFETINDDTFPEMPNIELLDLRQVLALNIGSFAFDPLKFPNLKILLLGGNNFAGIHQKHLSNQLLLLDLSNSKSNSAALAYFEIDRDTFIHTTELIVLNLSFNRIKAIFEYTFRGLAKLRILSLENGTLYHIGAGTFRPTRSLELLNLANNPLTATQNLTSAQFDGLNALKVLILTNCGIRRFNDDDNIFEMMPNLTHLILRNNQLYSISAETLKPLKNLHVLDLSENLLLAWWKPLFFASAVKPYQLLLTNNKISHFSVSMIQDISYLLDTSDNYSTQINLMDNVFICDCHSMYTTYLWLEVNGSMVLKEYFASSNFKCSSPDLWEDSRVADYLKSVRSLHCLMHEKISNVMVIVWTAPSLITIIMLLAVIITLYKYRIYVRYWIFLAKLALGRKFIRNTLKAENVEVKSYQYDAFVSYCYEDRDFVLEMISHVEKYPPYLKLCISERDFEVGSFISEAILTSINESRYVILLISNNFAKSQWCRWETQLAEYHRLFLEDGTTYDPLVLVRIGNVHSKYLTPTLKYLLKTKIYLTWDENNSEAFWKKLRHVLSKNK